MQLVARKDKKKIRAIILCHTGNKRFRKAKISKEDWLYLKSKYKVWLGCFNMSDRKNANTIR